MATEQCVLPAAHVSSHVQGQRKTFKSAMIAAKQYDPGSSHWGRAPLDSVNLGHGGADEDDDDDSDPGDFRMTGSHLVDKYIKTLQARQSGDGAPVRHETPADFDATMLSETFEDMTSTLGSHYSMKRGSRDLEYDFRLSGGTPKELKASHLAGGQHRHRHGSSDSMRRGDGESTMPRDRDRRTPTIDSIPEGEMNRTFASTDRRWQNGLVATHGLATDNEVSPLRSPPSWYNDDISLPSVVANQYLGQYNSLARERGQVGEGSYTDIAVHPRGTDEADGASTQQNGGASTQQNGRRKQLVQRQDSQRQAVVMAIREMETTRQGQGQTREVTPSETPSEDSYDYRSGSRDDVAQPTGQPDAARQQQQQQQYTQGRSPAHQLSLHDVVGFLNSRDTMVVANAAGYLQHASYNNDNVKTQLRELGAIPVLVGLILQRDEMVQHAAVGVLRNMSFGPRSTQNKYGICEAGGVEVLVRLLRNARSEDVQELVTGVLWNLSSCEDLKKHILTQSTTELVRSVIVPASGWDPSGDDANEDNSDLLAHVSWTSVLRNATGILRNLSSAGPEARDVLRGTEGLVDALLRMLRAAVGNNEVDNKSVENSMCVLRNLSFRMETEVEEQHVLYAEEAMKASNWQESIIKERADYEIQAKKLAKRDTRASFGFGRRRSSKKKASRTQSLDTDVVVDEPLPWRDGCPPFPVRSKAISGIVLLFQPEVVQPYIALAAEASNPETLEAAAGAIQNLTACNWKWSVFIRNAARKERGLPILSELLTIPSDAVVRTAATALRNLAVDPRNREMIGKFAMRDLVWRLPGEAGNENMSEATVGAVLCCLQELVTKNLNNARLLGEANGIHSIAQLAKAPSTPLKLGQIANRTCLILSNFKEIRIILKQEGWMYSYFVSSTRGQQDRGTDTATLHSMSDSRRNVGIGASTENVLNNQSGAPKANTRPHNQANIALSQQASRQDGPQRQTSREAGVRRQPSRRDPSAQPAQGDSAAAAPANIVQRQESRPQDAARTLTQPGDASRASQNRADVRLQVLSKQADTVVRQLSIEDNSWV